MTVLRKPLLDFAYLTSSNCRASVRYTKQHWSCSKNCYTALGGIATIDAHWLKMTTRLEKVNLYN